MFKIRCKKLNKGNIIFLSILILINFVLISLFEFREDIDIDLEIVGVDTVYLAVGETKDLELDIVTEEDGKFFLTYESSDSNVVSVDDNGNVTAKNKGVINVKASCFNEEKNIKVVVTDLITLPIYAQDKESLACEVYTESEAILLDEILKYDIESVGYGTRAGVVAAARFLSLKFPYKINYYFENGRLNSSRRKHIDGEGRYYHEGLYLSKSKYEILEANASTREPKMWGCELYANYTKSYSRNGLNCSGFVSWVLLNGGFDVGDLGAGISEEFDLTELGEKVDLNLDIINNNIKVGDLIGRDGHIGIIIGIDEETVYIAESYIPSLKVREFAYQELVESYEFDYVMLMDEVYKTDGKLTNMWS